MTELTELQLRSRIWAEASQEVEPRFEPHRLGVIVASTILLMVAGYVTGYRGDLARALVSGDWALWPKMVLVKYWVLWITFGLFVGLRIVRQETEKKIKQRYHELLQARGIAW